MSPETGGTIEVQKALKVTQHRYAASCALFSRTRWDMVDWVMFSHDFWFLCSLWRMARSS